MTQSNPSSNRIPIFDPRPEVELLWNEINAAIQGVLRSGQFIMGDSVQSLESAVAAYLGVRHAVAVNSGTDALTIGLRALGIGEGDEVIVPSFTFFATAESVSVVGARPVFVDIDPQSFNLDTTAVEAALTSRTRAIIPVHLFGQSAPMDRIMEIAQRNKLVVLEDVAQAFGAACDGRKSGAIGHGGALSFFPTKNLGAYGDAGMFVTNDEGAADMARMLRSHGSRRRYHNETLGYNSRMDSLQAAILNVKMPYVDSWNAARQAIAQRYDDGLTGLPGLTTPIISSSRRSHVFHQYTVRISGGMRDRVKEELYSGGIDTMIYYPVPVHRLPVYLHFATSLPRAEQAAQEVLSLPIWPQLHPDTQDVVISALRRALEGLR